MRTVEVISTILFLIISMVVLSHADVPKLINDNAAQLDGQDGAYYLNSTTISSWTYEQDFESLNTGDLNGQDSWEVTDPNCNVVTSPPPSQGTKHLQLSNFATCKREITGQSSGVLFVDIQAINVAEGYNGFCLSKDGTIFGETVKTGPYIGFNSDGEIIVYHTKPTARYKLGDYVDGSYYRIGIEFDCSTDKGRYNLNGGPWSNWLNFINDNDLSDLDQIWIGSNYGAIFYIDNISTLSALAQLPDTGQTKCFDNTQEITCPLSGEPFYGQDTQYPCNPQSYTQLNASGNDIPFSADYSTTPWAMVRDNVTGLIWEVKTDDGSIHDKDTTYNWQNAQDVFITALNNDSFGGHNDWRMPTVKELTLIVARDMYNPSIDNTYFPNSVSSLYWSSTPSAVYSTLTAWPVAFTFGSVDFYGKGSSYYVRAVRGGQVSSDFIDNYDETVTDTSTGLMWEVKSNDGGSRDKDNTYTWQEALSYCENLSLGGYNDWRLPDINDLQSIVGYDIYNPAIDTTFFPNIVYDDYCVKFQFYSPPQFQFYSPLFLV